MKQLELNRHADHEIIISDITKRFGKQIALDHVSFQMRSGHIYGFVGRNGSGKTVLMKMISGLLKPDTGEVRIDGQDPMRDNKNIPDMGILIENPGFITEYSGYENLRMLAYIKNEIGKDEIRAVMREVGLDDKEKKPVGKYSMGMRQRLGIAQAIMEHADIILLDEPMNGLDNHGVQEIRNILLELKNKNCLIIIASHNREDIEILCDQLIRLDAGHMEHMNA